jgi:glycosyltransferase involved in cell wall biosynthesis
MKIAHVVDSMEVGGAETLVLQMCRMQREQGHNPSVYAIAALGALGQQMLAEGFTVEANMGRHLTDSAINFYRKFRQLRPDVLHLHNPTPTIYASAAGKAAGAKTVVSTRHSLVAPPHNRMMESKYGIAAKFCDWVVGICDATTTNISHLRTVPGRKIVRIYNGTVPIEQIDEKHLPPKAGFTLLYVGRLEPVKNHELLLHAVRLGLADEPNLHLWMVGDGSERSRLEQIAAHLGITNHVTFWGQKLDVARYFRAADAFIMSSTSEGLPMSLLQSFSAGVPAIVTDVGGMAEVVRMSNAGLIVPLGDPDRMCAAILDLVKNPKERQNYSASSETAFKANFSLASMVDAYMQLYRRDRLE